MGAAGAQGRLHVPRRGRICHLQIRVPHVSWQAVWRDIHFQGTPHEPCSLRLQTAAYTTQRAGPCYSTGSRAAHCAAVAAKGSSIYSLATKTLAQASSGLNNGNCLDTARCSLCHLFYLDWCTPHIVPGKYCRGLASRDLHEESLVGV